VGNQTHSRQKPLGFYAQLDYFILGLNIQFYLFHPAKSTALLQSRPNLFCDKYYLFPPNLMIQKINSKNICKKRSGGAFAPTTPSITNHLGGEFHPPLCRVISLRG
jgi:hypothetical protein